MIGDSLKTYLETKTGLTDLVGTRIYRGRAGQNLDESNAYIVYHLLGREGSHYAEGAAAIPVVVFEIEIHAKSPRAAELVFEQFRLAIDGYRGTFGGDFANRCFLGDVGDIDDPPVHGDEKGFPGIRCTLDIAYTETVTSF